ncbi:hypothetical protein AB0J63_39200, partial [Streptosporangium canum]|uniref:hypothetical protein n=1 Tax=Streptosporangium canum TaxID=324952 RepID=UPI0034453FE4
VTVIPSRNGESAPPRSGPQRNLEVITIEKTSLAALRLFGRSRPAPPTRFDPQAVIANTVTMSLHEM